jgi:spore maturation protein CgeB
MKILVSYRGIPQSPDWATGDLVVKAFRDLGHEAYPYAKYYQKNNWVEGRPALDQDWDLILFMECNDGDPQYHELAVTRSRKTVCWFFDTSYHQNRYKNIVDYFRFDHIFLANPLTIQEYKVWGYNHVSYLPYACDPELHGRPLEYPKKYDVALIGSIRDDRLMLVDKLSQHGVNVEIIKNTFRENYIDALASTRIVINQNPPLGRGLLNMRWFETAAAGSIVLGEAEDLSCNDLWCFGTGHGYHSTEGLAEVCRTILGDQGTQDWIRGVTYKNVYEYHTYKHRCETILETIFPNERN